MKRKPVLNQDAVNGITRTLRVKCKMTPDAIRACIAEIEREATIYQEQVRRYGRHPDPATVRDEVGRLRHALRISNQTKDALLHAYWTRVAAQPNSAVLADHGKAVWEPDGLLRELDAWAAQVEAWIDPRPGRPNELQDRILVRYLARTFTQHTGRRATATPSAAFSEIVCCVLDALNVPRPARRGEHPTDRSPRKLIESALADLTGKQDKLL